MKSMKSNVAISTRHQRGSALILALLVSVVVTSIVMVVAWTATTLAQAGSSLSKMDQAFYAAESGAQKVAWYCRNSKMGSISSPLTGTVNGYTYSASWTTVSGSMIRITSTSNIGSMGYTIYQNASPITSSTPAMSAGGNNGNISGTVTVNGDLQCVKSINGGSSLTVTGNLTLGAALNGAPTVGGDLKVAGDCNGAAKVTGNMVITGNMNASPTVGKNLAVNGVINGHPTVGGTSTAHANNTVTVTAPPAVSTMAATLEATAGLTLNNPSSISVLDFTASPNGVIYVKGDANISGSLTVIGSGTLVISGNLNQSSRFPNTGTANVNIVCANDLNVSGGLYINGSLYSGHNWNQSGGFAVSGCVVIDSDENVSGSGTVTAGTPPSFDTRSGGSSGSTVFSSFAGPNP